MPNPKKGETLKEFTTRFMGDKHSVDKFPDIKQRYAIMRSIWLRRKKKASMAWVVNGEDYIVNDKSIEEELNEPVGPEEIE
jgi:hypothetical protein